MESKQHALTLRWETPQGTREATIEFPHRPTEAELGLKLAQFFGVDGFQFDEALRAIKNCALVQPQ